MRKIKASFTSKEGIELAGLLELPDAAPQAFALFAHCFTCSKDIAAASRIARGLAAVGIACLRFDFTGLGNSDGDFANSNFSSNIQDLNAAAAYLEAHYEAPKLLIGHSLGGAAVLAAAHDLPSVEAIATIGAPATAKHVEHLFADARADLAANDEAAVSIGGREFNIKQQFLHDLDRYASTEHIGKLKRAVLICHSPIDTIVDVNEAARIYQAAKHPKSFVSLDKADHLLSNKADSAYVASVIATWAARYLSVTPAAPAKRPELADGEVYIGEANHKFKRTIHTRDHSMIADEPLSIGGDNSGPNPYDLLLASLGACTSMTIRMFAERKKIPLSQVDVRLSHSRVHAEDCAECESDSGQVDVITKEIRLEGELSSEQQQRLLQIADRCPVHKTLHNEISIRTRLA